MAADYREVIVTHTVYPKKYAHRFVVLCFVVVMQSFIMNSHEVFIHIHQGCFAGTGAIVRLPQCQWSKPGGYGKISQCITTTKHTKAKTVCIFLGIYCMDQDTDHCWPNPWGAYMFTEVNKAFATTRSFPRPAYMFYSFPSKVRSTPTLILSMDRQLHPDVGCIYLSVPNFTAI